jgi:hypothetical protein
MPGSPGFLKSFWRKTMPKRIPLQTVVLWRDGEQVVPPLNRAFDFTKEELDTIEKLNPAAIGKIVNSDATDTIVTKTQAEIDADTEKAVADAIAAFKKEQGIKDEPAKTDAGTSGATPDKNAKSDKTDKGGKSAGAGKDAGADDDI